MTRRELWWVTVLAAAGIAGPVSFAKTAASRPAGELRRPAIGLWYTVWWTRDDRFHHWDRCNRFPTLGRYGAGEPEVIAAHYAQFRDLGIDFLIMDDTNGCGNDAGRINDNIRAWFDFMDRQPADARVPICIGGGGEMRDGGAAAQKRAADYYAEQWAGRPSYYQFAGKPLLLVDTDKNYGPGDFDDPRFTVRWVYNCDNTASIGRRQTWGWGAYDPVPILDECMSIMPGHRYAYNLPKHLSDPQETAREGGELYVRMWLRVLKARPQVVALADWNNFIEETAIEDCHGWEDPRGYAVSNLYTRITRAYSRLRDSRLVAGEYYRDESKSEVYRFDGRRLIHELAMPTRATVIVVPAGMLHEISRRLGQ
ncbi:MAG: hypothetical protein HY718_17230 [Planctomycetes bacterium]|nr:hypothetical protein [Planctomycetota bacterium]